MATFDQTIRIDNRANSFLNHLDSDHRRTSTTGTYTSKLSCELRWCNKLTTEQPKQTRKKGSDTLSLWIVWNWKNEINSRVESHVVFGHLTKPFDVFTWWVKRMLNVSSEMGWGLMRQIALYSKQSANCDLHRSLVLLRQSKMRLWFW